jgi:transposase
MAKTRREFTAEFKWKAVALWETSGRPQMEIVAELGLQPSQLRRWQRLLHQGKLEGLGSSPTPVTITKAPAFPAPADLAAENVRLRLCCTDTGRPSMRFNALMAMTTSVSRRWSFDYQHCPPLGLKPLRVSTRLGHCITPGYSDAKEIIGQCIGCSAERRRKRALPLPPEL